MDDKKPTKLEALKCLIDGSNIYTGEIISGVDEKLKKDLLYIFEYLSKRVKPSNAEKTIVNEVAPSSNAVENVVVLRKGRIVVEGQRYTLADGMLFDSTGIKVSESKAEPILFKYYSNINYASMDEEQKLEYIKALKYAKFYQMCIDVIEKEFRYEHESNFIKTILPIYTSSLREIKKPELAIKFWDDNCWLYSKCESVALFTSLASAYCDVRDYVNARRFADRAYARRGGGSSGYETELSLVYKRIKKQTGEN